MTLTEKIKLSPEARRIVRRWIRDLRSGKYKQARGRLVRKVAGDWKEEQEGMCCLGVLSTQIARGRRTVGGYRWDGEQWVRGGDWNSATIPARVCKALGLEAIAEIEDQLTVMNDSITGTRKGGRHRTFTGIAQWLERRFEL